MIVERYFFSYFSVKNITCGSHNYWLAEAILTSTQNICEPCCEKTCLRGFGPGKTQTSLLSYRDQLEF